MDVQEGDGAIQYRDGYIYSIRKKGLGGDPPVLTRVSADGSKKDVLYAWDRDTG